MRGVSAPIRGVSAQHAGAKNFVALSKIPKINLKLPINLSITLMFDQFYFVTGFSNIIFEYILLCTAHLCMKTLLC